MKSFFASSRPSRASSSRLRGRDQGTDGAQLTLDETCARPIESLRLAASPASAWSRRWTRQRRAEPSRPVGGGCSPGIGVVPRTCSRQEEVKRPISSGYSGPWSDTSTHCPCQAWRDFEAEVGVQHRILLDARKGTHLLVDDGWAASWLAVAKGESRGYEPATGERRRSRK